MSYLEKVAMFAQAFYFGIQRDTVSLGMQYPSHKAHCKCVQYMGDRVPFEFWWLSCFAFECQARFKTRVWSCRSSARSTSRCWLDSRDSAWKPVRKLHPDLFIHYNSGETRQHNFVRSRVFHGWPVILRDAALEGTAFIWMFSRTVRITIAVQNYERL